MPAGSPPPERNCELATGCDWARFYDTYPRSFGTREYLKQVAHTIKGEPIGAEQVALMLADMCSLLDLQPDDTLLDLCCGNGFFTQKLAATCKQVVGVDFSEPLLEVAERDHCPPNVSYVRMNALEVGPEAALGSTRFDKVVMCAALQHFAPRELPPLLENLLVLTTQRAVIAFVLVPDRRKKWSFYDTPQKRAAHRARVARGEERMGTWWHPEDFLSPCARLGLQPEFLAPDPGLHAAGFRFNVRLVARA